MRILFAFIVLFMSSMAEAGQYRLLDVDQLNMELAQFGCNRDPMVPEIECGDWRGRAEINADLRLITYMYWKNRVHGEGTNAAFKSVGWNYELGINVSKYIDVFYLHHSRHPLDQGNAVHTSSDGSYTLRNKFPVEDSYGVRLIFYDKHRPKNSLFEKLYP